MLVLVGSGFWSSFAPFRVANSLWLQLQDKIILINGCWSLDDWQTLNTTGNVMVRCSDLFGPPTGDKGRWCQRVVDDIIKASRWGRCFSVFALLKSGGDESMVVILLWVQWRSEQTGRKFWFWTRSVFVHSAGLFTSTRSVPAVPGSGWVHCTDCSRCSRIKHSHEPQLSVLFAGCFQVCGGETAEDCLALWLSVCPLLLLFVSQYCFSPSVYPVCLLRWSFRQMCFSEGLDPQTYFPSHSVCEVRFVLVLLHTELCWEPGWLCGFLIPADSSEAGGLFPCCLH